MLKTKHLIYGIYGTILFLGCYGPSAFAQGDSGPVEIAALYKCKAIANTSERLTCYDTTVGRLETAHKTGEIITLSKGEATEIKQDAFGFNIPSLPNLGKIFDKNEKTTNTPILQSAIKSISSSNGYMRIILENGQIWKQTASSTLNAKRIMRREKREAHINKASLGSYKLRINGNGPSMKVKRIK